MSDNCRMNASMQSFDPLNELEGKIAAGQAGKLPLGDVLQALMESRVYTLVDKDPGPEGKWDDSISPLILANQAGKPLLAVFTAEERAASWPQQYPQFKFGFFADFYWWVKGIDAAFGIVVNPGSSAGMELLAPLVQELKVAAQQP